MPALVVVALAAAGAVSIRFWRNGRAIAVRTAIAQSARADRTATVLNATGYVTARRRATVSSRITGKLTEVRVEEGMPVRQGQVLARLDDREARAALALAESRRDAARRAVEETEIRLRLARLTLDRRERLVAEGIAGQEELDQARTEVEALEARGALDREQVQVAEREIVVQQTQLADTVIRAPFDGVVISKDAQPGEMVSPVSAGGGFTRTGICTVVDMDSLEIEVDVNESYISRVEPGQPVEAVLDAYPDWKIPARVITTVPAADRQRATVLVRIGFEQLDQRILPDMGVKVAFQDVGTEEEGPDRGTVLVPRDALRRDDGRDVVFVVRDARVERRAVRLGSRAGDPVEVIAGLTPGERVVVRGPDGLTDGDAVTFD